MLSSLPAARRVLWSAFRAGSLAGVVPRVSRRAVSGAVLWCAFRSPARAGRFARLWSGRLGRSVFVRRRPGRCGPLFVVSVPVAGGPPFQAQPVPVVGGVRGVAAVALAVTAAYL